MRNLARALAWTLLAAAAPAGAATPPPPAAALVQPPAALSCAGAYSRRDAPIAWIDTSDAFGFELEDDDVVFLNLPFEVDSFGARSQTVVVSSNGWLSLFENDPVTTTGSNSDPIPYDGTPVGVIAPWWTDLDPEAGGTVADARWVRVKTVGCAPDRTWVLTWERFPAYLDPISSFTFQVTIQERSNVIRFQYLEMIGDPRRLPEEWLTIGLENAGGTQGNQYLHDTLRDMTGRAIEYTPSAPALGGCGGATVLSCPTVRLSNQTMSGTNDQRLYGCSTAGSFDGRERVYSLDLTGVSIVSLAVTPASPGRNLRAFILGGCNPCNCVEGDQATVRAVLGPGRYSIVIDAPTAADNGPFDLSLDCESILGQPTCGPLRVGTPATCPLVIDFDRFGDGRGVWSGGNWIHDQGDRTYHALRVDGGRIYSTNFERSRCLPMTEMVSWVDDNTDKAVSYWRVPEAEVVQTVFGTTAGSCCGLRVETRVRNLDSRPHFFEFRSLYQTDFGPAAGACFPEARVEGGPLRIGAGDYLDEQNLTCDAGATPPGRCGLLCQSPIELRSADDQQVKLVLQNQGLGTPEAVQGAWVDYYDVDRLCSTSNPEPWMGGYAPTPDPIAGCQAQDAVLVAWRLPPGLAASCAAPGDCLQPGEEIAFTHLLGNGCRLNAGCSTCLAAADLMVPERSLCLGGSVTLDASSSQIQGCAGTVTYTWSRDGAADPPGTDPTYRVSEPSAGAHTYAVRVSCEPPPGLPCADSRSAEVTTFDCSTCSITAQLTSPGPSTCRGEPLVLDARSSVINDCPGTVGYGWLRDGAQLAGETSSTYTVLEPAAGSHDYAVIVRCDPPPVGLACQSTSAPVQVTTLDAPPVTITPDPAAYCPGTPALVLDAGAGFATYRWQPGGETTPAIQVSPTVPTTYSVAVTSASGCPGADSIDVGVSSGAAAAGSVTPLAQCESAPATVFNALAASVPPAGSTLAYAWSLPGSPAGWSIAAPSAAATAVTAASPVTVPAATLHLDVTTLPGGCVSGIDFALSVGAGGSALGIGSRLLAVKSPGGVDLSWPANGAATYDAHQVTVKSDIPTIFTTPPAASSATPAVTVGASGARVFLQVQGLCP